MFKAEIKIEIERPLYGFNERWNVRLQFELCLSNFFVIFSAPKCPIFQVYLVFESEIKLVQDLNILLKTSLVKLAKTMCKKTNKRDNSFY